MVQEKGYEVLAALHLFQQYPDVPAIVCADWAPCRGEHPRVQGGS